MYHIFEALQQMSPYGRRLRLLCPHLFEDVSLHVCDRRPRPPLARLRLQVCYLNTLCCFFFIFTLCSLLFHVVLSCCLLGSIASSIGRDRSWTTTFARPSSPASRTRRCPNRSTRPRSRWCAARASATHRASRSTAASASRASGRSTAPASSCS